MKSRGVRAIGIVFLIAISYVFRSTAGLAWNEKEFFQKRIVTRSFVPTAGSGDMTAQTLVGSPHWYTIQKKDTLLDIARYYDLGYNELIEAYSNMSPWLPEAGALISVPTTWIVPNSRHEGVIVNIPEMRLYYFPASTKKNRERTVITLPVGLGREEWPTPQTLFRVRGKTRNPVFRRARSWFSKKSMAMDTHPSPGGDFLHPPVVQREHGCTQSNDTFGASLTSSSSISSMDRSRPRLRLRFLSLRCKRALPASFASPRARTGSVPRY